MPARQPSDKFLIAFSFAGEQRDLVRAIAESVEKKLGYNTVFLDEWFEHWLAGADADLKLQKIYARAVRWQWFASQKLTATSPGLAPNTPQSARE